MDKAGRLELEGLFNKTQKELASRRNMVRASEKVLEERTAARRSEICEFVDELRDLAIELRETADSTPSLKDALKSVYFRFDNKPGEYVYFNLYDNFCDVEHNNWGEYGFIRISKKHPELKEREDALFANRTLICIPRYSDATSYVMDAVWSIVACFYLVVGKDVDKAIAKLKEYIESAVWDRCFGDDDSTDKEIEATVYGEDLYNSYLSSDYT